MLRTHDAGTLRATDAGSTVTLAGWVARRRDHGGVVFLDLRDASGYAQVVVREEEAHALRNEYCVLVTGDVQRRPAGNENADLPTGEIEVVASTLQVLSASAPLPFPIETAQAAGDDVRYAHRYLDLRRQGPASVLRLRSEVNRIARGVMAGHGFTEVETPSLTRSTPEGARDFVVPVRLQPGHWYALPQSPQLFKQLLMIGGLERYYQIARCFRDEDFRADRQPEFTQLDFEMSFVDRDDVLAIAEDVIRALWQELASYTVPEIPRMTYREAMDRFGSDKPDLRFGIELTELTSYFADTPFRVFQAPYVGAIVMPGGGSQPRRAFDAWQDWARSRGHKGLAYVTIAEDGTLGGPVSKNISESERAGLVEAVGAEPGDCVFFAAGPRRGAQELLGAARNEIAKRLELIEPGSWSFLFVVDFPMFEETEDGDWTFMHHPFTSPTPEWRERFAEDKGAALSDAYDLVCNGNELMSGSVRIADAALQERVFQTLGMTQEEARAQFGWFLEAFDYGPPPHAGAAIGWDRTVALLAGVDSIREVIAFPKTGAGYDPLTGAPTPITPAQRTEAGIDVDPDAEPAPGEPGAPGPTDPTKPA
ncbi:aspartate--tRNA ligase [Modestobacter sp. VKM Ac-2979]|uniref:aspartate--tRNA ligase n=1 Tax=unclassified Modestobacter TaxID=2643866 RepID=UPI0022AB936F|nr:MULTISPECIES: aspartate--tRNA ligase [unclassified Modestobacter]MCZ2812859.1 aspartate--tRNA ligase [Modestobacter sp. VKM Ac-2979]MCZ2843112.1 aspartate--tRNA ligase [Modestobacter sp. VKM Ac-2980]